MNEWMNELSVAVQAHQLMCPWAAFWGVSRTEAMRHAGPWVGYSSVTYLQ